MRTGRPLHSHTAYAVPRRHYLIQRKPLLRLRPLLRGTLRPHFCPKRLRIRHVIGEVTVSSEERFATHALRRRRRRVASTRAVRESRSALCRREFALLAIEAPFEILKVPAIRKRRRLIGNILSAFRQRRSNPPGPRLCPVCVDFYDFWTLVEPIEGMLV